MSKPKYLYIDDEKDHSVEAVASGFDDQNMIEVVIEQPQDFKTQKNYLIEKLKDYDGLILDFRLDQNMQLDVSYNAPAIAQELRMAVSNPDVKLKACPIILCSTDERMRATYDADKSSHDLFDYKFLKGSEPNWFKFSTKLASLADGYNWLSSSKKSIREVLGRENLDGIDSRIFERFLDQENPPLVYDYAHFIVKEVFHHPGPLIKESVLAARLGVDIDKSQKDWLDFRDRILTPFKYSGLFSNGWRRWWSDQVIQFFKDHSDGKRLSTISAKERVAFLNEKFEINLTPASPLPYAKSSNFWTICEASKKPLDPLEGFKVYQRNELKGWQEPKYVSFNAVAAEGLPKNKGLRLQPNEQSRIQAIKESYK